MKQLKLDFNEINLLDHYEAHEVIDKGENKFCSWSDSLSDDGKKQLEIKEAAVILKFILEKVETLDAALFTKEEAIDLINLTVEAFCKVDIYINSRRLVLPFRFSFFEKSTYSLLSINMNSICHHHLPCINICLFLCHI